MSQFKKDLRNKLVIIFHFFFCPSQTDWMTTRPRMRFVLNKPIKTHMNTKKKKVAKQKTNNKTTNLKTIINTIVIWTIYILFLFVLLLLLYLFYFYMLVMQFTITWLDNINCFYYFFSFSLFFIIFHCVHYLWQKVFIFSLLYTTIIASSSLCFSRCKLIKRK